LVDDGDYMRRLIRYIHLNPVEADIAKSPSDYRWSSHNAYFGNDAFSWLDTERVLSHFGKTRAQALENLRVFMERKGESKVDRSEIHAAFRKGAYGDTEFTRIFAENVDFSTPVPQESAINLDELIACVCQRFDVSLELLKSSEKSRAVVNARAVLARAAKTLNGLSMGDVCRALGKHNGTISRLAAKASKQARLNLIVDELVQGLH
jgi:hypothetical protein